MASLSRVLFLLAVCFGVSVPAAMAQSQTPYPAPSPSPLQGLEYALSLYPAVADHDPAVPNPDAFLGFPVGQRTATSAQIDAYIRQLAAASDRVELVHYGDTYEGRPLSYLVISSPENLARTESIQSAMADLADPRGLSARQRTRLIQDTPAVAWMSYSIHGNESSGSDASLAVMYHLAADRSAETLALLEDLVIIVDPNKNPDGRERFVNSLQQHRGTQPNVDDQSLLHTGYWPFGRGNHYLFDLNRDWIYGRHPETRGRIPHITLWRPLVFVDAHEMGSQDTFLFSPAREPHNPNLPPYRATMSQVFADDMAAAFDEFGYPYYSGEWHEDWYPGYTDAWASMRGALGILYEQARIAEDGVQRPTHLLSYRQSVHHQVLASFANLRTLQREREAMMTAFADDRADVVSARGPYANRSFVILPSDNHGRLMDFLDLVALQSFELHRVTQDTRVRSAIDQLGRQLSNFTLPRGALVLRNRQPEARSLAAMFEFDPKISEAALTNERERVLREGRSTIYDTTGWNITMMFGLDAVTIPEFLDTQVEEVDPLALLAALGVPDTVAMTRDVIAVVASGLDDRVNAAAARLMERGVSVRSNRESSALNGIPLPVGSIAVTVDDNRHLDDWAVHVQAVADDLGLSFTPVMHGRAPGDLADLGGQQWRVLMPPRIGLISRGMNNMLDFGAVWYVLDHRIGIRHSHLDEDRAGNMDLRRYNVIYLPERWGSQTLPANLVSSLHEWVRQGGTLVASGNAARALMAGDQPMVSTRPIERVIGEDLSPYQDTLHREWLASNQPLPEKIWGHAAESVTYPWQSEGVPGLPSSDERVRRDEWQRLFMPSGALVATRADANHWLNAGRGEQLAVLFSNSPVMMAKHPVEAPLRLGVFSEGGDHAGGLVNWSPVPEGNELRIRAGGLLWPEARERVASSAWLTREQVGRGQVILFAHAPAFRGAQLGAIRVLENALILGPGLGTSQPVM